MKKIAVVLSGCGVKDGSEIYEATCTYLALEHANAEYSSVAPNIEFDEIDHLTENPTGNKRNVLTESMQGKVAELYVIGDAAATGNAAGAMRQGFEIGQKI